MIALSRTAFHKIFLFFFFFFRDMTVGKKLWIIILIKLFIMFFILKIFFFPDILKVNFNNDRERGDYVIEQLVKPR